MIRCRASSARAILMAQASASFFISSAVRGSQVLDLGPLNSPYTVSARGRRISIAARSWGDSTDRRSCCSTRVVVWAAAGVLLARLGQGVDVASIAYTVVHNYWIAGSRW